MEHQLTLQQEILLYSILVDVEENSPLQELFKSLEKVLLDCGVDLKLANETVKNNFDNNDLVINYKKLCECL